MAGSQVKVEKMKLRQDYRNLWHSDLMGTVTADTPCKISISFDFFIFIVLFNWRTDFRFLGFCLFLQIASCRAYGKFKLIYVSLGFCNWSI